VLWCGKQLETGATIAGKIEKNSKFMLFRIKPKYVFFFVKRTPCGFLLYVLFEKTLTEITIIFRQTIFLTTSYFKYEKNKRSRQTLGSIFLTCSLAVQMSLKLKIAKPLIMIQKLMKSSSITSFNTQGWEFNIYIYPFAVYKQLIIAKCVLTLSLFRSLCSGFQLFTSRHETSW